MRRQWILFSIVATLLFSACGKKPRPPAPAGAGKGTESASVQRGLASWYGRGDGYHGKVTASGERFDRNRLTAAHFTLPFGTRVEVRNLKNGRKVVVRINDRFPEATLGKGRIIDLSYRAAKELGMVRDGVVPVEVKVVSASNTKRSHP